MKYFRMGRRLFCVRLFHGMFGRNFWETVTKANIFMEDDGRYAPPSYYYNYHHKILHNSSCILVLTRNNNEITYCTATPVVRCATPIVHLWRIQRAVRRFIEERRSRMRMMRLVAVAMAFHSRLGGGTAAAAAGVLTTAVGSPLAVLPVDLFVNHCCCCCTS